MEFRILGSMEVIDESRRVDLPAGRGRSLLALLILHLGEVVSADRLIDELWGEHPPATASTVVQGLVSRLRKTLEPGRGKGETPAILQTVGIGYRLALDPLSVDANRFKALLDQSHVAAAPDRSRVLAEALALWRGPALTDFRYEPFAQRAITALEELRLTAIEDRFDADLALGRHGELVAEIERLAAANPFRERFRGQLMLALYRAGRQAEALEIYQRTRATLLSELGVEPGPALRHLEQSILRQDPSIDLPPEQGSTPQLPEPAPVATAWLPRERRTVTVLVADFVASAEPGTDPEALARIAQRAVARGTEAARRSCGGERRQRLAGILRSSAGARGRCGTGRTCRGRSAGGS